MLGKLFRKMAKLVINNQSFTGTNVSIRGSRVYIDGVEVDAKLAMGQQELEIRVTEGILGSLDAGGSVSCGEVHGDVDAGSSIMVSGSVGGSADAGSSVSVTGNVSGDIDAGSSVTVGGSVGGSIDAGGSVRVGKA